MPIADSTEEVLDLLSHIKPVHKDIGNNIGRFGRYPRTPLPSLLF